MTQETHHHKKTIKEEYIEMLKNHELVFPSKYLFDFFDDVNSWGVK